MRRLAAVAALALSACLTPAQSAQIQSDVQVAVNTIAPLACTIVTLADPTQASTVCSIVDAAGNIVTTLAPVVLPIATAQAVVSAHPASPAVAAVHAAKFGAHP